METLLIEIVLGLIATGVAAILFQDVRLAIKLAALSQRVADHLEAPMNGEIATIRTRLDVVEDHVEKLEERIERRLR